jgi:STE24 endopeptidase
VTEAHAARREPAGSEQDGDVRRGVPPWWPATWAFLCLGALGVGWWLLVPHDPTGGLELDPVDPTAGLDPSELERSQRYATWARPFEMAALVLPISAVLLVGLTTTGATWTARIATGVRLQSLRALLVAFVVVAVAWVVTLPAEAGVEVVQQAAGTFVGGWQGWAVDRLVQLLQWWAVAGAVVLLVRLAARLFRRSWWVMLTLVAFVLVLTGVFAFGRLSTVEADYPPLPDGPLRTAVLALADETGVDVTDVRVVPESISAGQYNAYVTGFGSDRVVVLHGLLVLLSTPAETEFVAAHELAHVDTNDSLRRALLAGLAAALVTAMVGAAAASSRVRSRAGTRRTRIADASAVPMVMALALAAGMVAVPALDAAGRRFEWRADVTALGATDNPAALRGAVSRTAQLYLKEPHPPWIGRVLTGHPSTAERIALADAWDNR